MSAQTNRGSLLKDHAPIEARMADVARLHDAEQGSRALLELQVRYHQYPCKIAGEE